VWLGWTQANFVKRYLLTHPAFGNNINDQPITVSSSGLKKVYAGTQSAGALWRPVSDPRHGRGQTLGQKICGHQGAGSQDMAADSAASAPRPRSVTRPAPASEPSRVPPR
jgi:hypothetical protein